MIWLLIYVVCTTTDGHRSCIGYQQNSYKDKVKCTKAVELFYEQTNISRNDKDKKFDCVKFKIK